MDRPAVEDLLRFTEYAWSAFQRAIRPRGDPFLTSPAPGSGWPALADALSHINWAYIRWLSDPESTTDEEVAVVSSWAELDRYRERVRGDARRYLDSTPDSELIQPREMRVDGRPMLYSPAEVFATVLLHERQHHGDLNTLLYQLGADIPVIEYRHSLPDRQVGR